MKKQYGFQESMNEYRLNSNARFMLKEQGFLVLFDDEIFPDELALDRCKAMYLEMAPKESFINIKLGVVFRDCHNKILFTCTDGTSKEKSKQLAYNEALEMALKSVKTVNYKYNEVAKSEVPVAVASTSSGSMLLAKPITNGYKLMDSDNKVVMTILKTSNKECFLASMDDIQGVLLAKEYQWFFEYYKDNQLYSERIKVSF